MRGELLMGKTHRFRRALAAALSLLYFTVHVVLADAAEANFWAERRRSAEGSRKKNADQTLMAGIPAASPEQVLQQLPPASSQPLSLAVSKQLPPEISRDPGGPVMELLNALPAPYGAV